LKSWAKASEKKHRFETKKTLITGVIQRLDVGNGEVVHFTPSPWARPFF
jgi:hypothetical protein